MNKQHTADSEEVKSISESEQLFEQVRIMKAESQARLLAHMKESGRPVPEYPGDKCTLCFGEGELCEEHSHVDYGYEEPVEGCEECRQLCPEHKTYGFSCRPKDVNYGRVFTVTFRELFKRWQEQADSGIADPAQLFDWGVKASINSVKKAEEQARCQILEALDGWRLAELSSRNGCDEDTWDDGDNWDHEYDMRKSDVDRQFTLEIFPQLRKPFIDILEYPDKTAAAELAGIAHAGERTDDLILLGLIEKLYPEAVLVGIEAYIEASALLTRSYDELRPPAFAHAIVTYYLGRRSKDEDLIGTAKVQMVYGSDSNDRGPVYRMAWHKFDSLSDVDREIAAEKYCDKFLQALDRLPVEVWLAPALPTAWALQAGEWAAKEVLSKRLPMVQLEETRNHFGSQVAPPDESELINVERLIQYQSMPHYDLILRHYGDGVPLSQLASELGISKQAIHKRISKFVNTVKQQ